MKDRQLNDYLAAVLRNAPADWLELTTHRLDIYDEARAKSQFTEAFAALFAAGNADREALAALPTAFDYIRLGHPLSCVLEWAVGRLNGLPAEHVISFASRTMPVLAVLRRNRTEGKPTRILHRGALPEHFAPDVLRRVYDYEFTLEEVSEGAPIAPFAGSTVYLTAAGELFRPEPSPDIDFFVGLHGERGSILLVNGEDNTAYVPAVQHVRRRESIAMTPADCRATLLDLLGMPERTAATDRAANEAAVTAAIREITGTAGRPLLGSSGLSVQYAIMMGLIDNARAEHPGKTIQIVVPPNCYGGTNDQARRVAAVTDGVEITDLPVDGDNDMVRSVESVLTAIAAADAVPYIIAEIPTNPRVEVPDLRALRAALAKPRSTASGAAAVGPVFILDQTFCPNVNFLGEGGILAGIRSISYASGSKFPSGGRCTAGYCVGSAAAQPLMTTVERHLLLTDNQATGRQLAILAEQLPSMNDRIAAAYRNTRDFVEFIRRELPAAKINFVSEELAAEGFTPSVFSLDLPSRGGTPAEREAYKRELNHKLIRMMIGRIPGESKHCVSYGQLKGCYWTIPATSTQGTTKEADKDYIARVSLSPDMDLERHKKVFREFVAEHKLPLP